MINNVAHIHIHLLKKGHISLFNSYFNISIKFVCEF